LPVSELFLPSQLMLRKASNMEMSADRLSNTGYQAWRGR